MAVNFSEWFPADVRQKFRGFNRVFCKSSRAFGKSSLLTELETNCVIQPSLLCLWLLVSLATRIFGKPRSSRRPRLSGRAKGRRAVLCCSCRMYSIRICGRVTPTGQDPAPQGWGWFKAGRERMQWPLQQMIRHDDKPDHSLAQTARPSLQSTDAPMELTHVWRGASVSPSLDASLFGKNSSFVCHERHDFNKTPAAWNAAFFVLLQFSTSHSPEKCFELTPGPWPSTGKEILNPAGNTDPHIQGETAAKCVSRTQQLLHYWLKMKYPSLCPMKLNLQSIPLLVKCIDCYISHQFARPFSEYLP